MFNWPKRYLHAWKHISIYKPIIEKKQKPNFFILAWLTYKSGHLKNVTFAFISSKRPKKMTEK